MATKEVSVTVSDKSYDLMLATAELIAVIKEAVDDGWQMGEDFSKILSGVVAFVPALKGVDDIKAEFAEDKEAFAKAISVGLASLAGQFIK